MRGEDIRTGSLFSYVDLEARVPKEHPLRPIRRIIDAALSAPSPAFAALYAPIGRPSIPPERLIRALLLQAFYSIRSERQLMEQPGYNLLFRWFVGLGIDDPAWDVTVFHQEPRPAARRRHRPGVPGSDAEPAGNQGAVVGRSTSRSTAR